MPVKQLPKQDLEKLAHRLTYHARIGGYTLWFIIGIPIAIFLVISILKPTKTTFTAENIGPLLMFVGFFVFGGMWLVRSKKRLFEKLKEGLQVGKGVVTEVKELGDNAGFNITLAVTLPSEEQVKGMIHQLGVKSEWSLNDEVELYFLQDAESFIPQNFEGRFAVGKLITEKRIQRNRKLTTWAVLIFVGLAVLGLVIGMVGKKKRLKKSKNRVQKVIKR